MQMNNKTSQTTTIRQKARNYKQKKTRRLVTTLNTILIDL